ncbi:MAG TPA: hypothetical protein VJ464_15495 [Blastocatellia bacterium]|nr:hypothetical protein [Blastocatellia bacterium]
MSRGRLGCLHDLGGDAVGFALVRVVCRADRELGLYGQTARLVRWRALSKNPGDSTIACGALKRQDVAGR